MVLTCKDCIAPGRAGTIALASCRELREDGTCQIKTNERLAQLERGMPVDIIDVKATVKRSAE